MVQFKRAIGQGQEEGGVGLVGGVTVGRKLTICDAVCACVVQCVCVCVCVKDVEQKILHPTSGGNRR